MTGAQIGLPKLAVACDPMEPQTLEALSQLDRTAEGGRTWRSLKAG